MDSMTAVTFHPRGLLVLLLFAGALAFALVPRWGAIAAAGCVLVEFFLLLGIAGFGRGGDDRCR
jgi:hypothetical protein